MKYGMTSAGIGLFFAVAGCSSYEVIPDHLEGQVREDIQLEQVEKTLDPYKGETVVWGGEVLSASIQGDAITIEILQLPLDRTLRPMDSKPASKGRFLAIDAHRDIKNADSLKKGTLVTVIGEVQGLVASSLDQGSYEAPAILIRDMTIWDRQIGMTRYPVGSPFIGYRPFVFWDSHRIAGQ